MLLALAATLSAQEKAPDAEVAKLRETIAKIVDMKAQASAEKSDWEVRKASMADLLELQRRELELLDEELEKSGQSAEGYDAKKQEAEAEIAKLRDARRAAVEAVSRTRPRVLALVKALPAPLFKEIETETYALEAWASGDEARDGLQAILGILSKAEQFNRRITRAKEVRKGQEVEVLYLGLARAYYTDRNGNAGTGEPAAGGWTWTSRPELAGEVIKALDELDRKRPPELVRLPVQILEVK
ncbi:hypothetical protein Hhel01_03533 [Haloferula helveola]